MKPPARSPLAGRIGFVLLHRIEGGLWASAEPVMGEYRFADGDDIAFEIANRHDEDVFLCVLDLGLTGKVHLLYPEPGAPWRPLPPGGVLFEDGLTLEVPADYPPENPGECPALGKEVFTLFATTDGTDVRPFVEDGETAVGTLAEPLAAVLGRDLAMAPCQEPEAPWTMVHRKISLRRLEHK